MAEEKTGPEAWRKDDMTQDVVQRVAMGRFLRQNPFPHPLTDGLFYREKMRAIHRVAPASIGHGGERPRILEIGGGRSGMARLLFPGADIVNVDIDPTYAAEAANSDVTFVCADACDLPFRHDSFDCVTMFDVLEHIDDDAKAVSEARRVTRSGGTILVSCPDADWRYPHHPFMIRVANDERTLMDEWGHVRRGYSTDQLNVLFGRPADRSASFINHWSALYHDIAFSRLGRIGKTLAYAAAAPVAAFGYLTDRGTGKGTETAYAWVR
jgi:SAM-dependent methyltransferase